MTKPGIDELIREELALTRLCESADALSRGEIEELQLRKLNALLRREHIRGGYYSKLPERLNSLNELNSLPFTTDEDLAHNAPGLLLTSQSEIQRVLSDATSGTTGTPKRVFYTKNDCNNTIRLFEAGLGELVYPGSKTLICMPFSGPFGLGELIAEAIRRLGARPVNAGVGLSYGELKKLLNEEKPDTAVSMPVPLLSMLRVLGSNSLKRALVSGDSCSHVIVNETEKLLGTRLFPHYGSREMALGGAVSCQHHCGMHLRENHVIAEIVDEQGNTLPEGEWGELVISTIGMEAMPLIRYKTGDITRIVPGACPCGCAARRLDRVTRKDTELMEKLDSELFSIPMLVDYSVCKEEKGFSFNILSTDALPENAVRARLEEITGSFCEISLRSVSSQDSALYQGKRHILTKAPELSG